jgi:NADH dehydrogenase FAD-containing subunit
VHLLHSIGDTLAVMSTVDPALGHLVHAQLAARGVEVLTGTTVRQITRAAPGEAAPRSGHHKRE